MIIVPCFKRASRAARGACVVIVIAAGIPVAGCGGGWTAAGSPLAAASSRVPERADSDVAYALETELRHFNVYQDFRAMSEMSGGVQAKVQDAAVPADAKIDIGRYFSCSVSSLIRQGDWHIRRNRHCARPGCWSIPCCLPPAAAGARPATRRCAQPPSRLQRPAWCR